MPVRYGGGILMAQTVNYLPFCQRNLADAVATGQGLTKVESRISTFSMGFENKVILGDLTLRLGLAAPLAASTARFGMRLGWLSKGYLLDYPVPLGVFTNRRRGYASVWKFPRPFTLFPGESLSAFITPVGGGRYLFPRGIMFNGVRQSDGRPWALYETSPNTLAATRTAIVGPGLQCPTDSPVDIYSVSVDEFQTERMTASYILQVKGPGSREWFKVDSDILTAALPEVNWETDCWLSPPISYITLGEDHGWVMESNEALLVEVVSLAAGAFQIESTLRGSLEVPV